MKIEPRNRYLWLAEVEKNKKEETTTVLLPEGYTAQTNAYGVYQIAKISLDCTKVTERDLGKYVVVNEIMVETASLDQGNFLLIQENHIYGILED